MGGFARVHEHGRGAGRGQGGGDLAGDVAGFTHARDHHAAAAAVQQLDGAHEIVVVAEARVQGANGVGFDGQGLAAQLQHTAGLVRVKTFQHYFFMGYTHVGSINELGKQKTCQS